MCLLRDGDPGHRYQEPTHAVRSCTQRFDGLFQLGVPKAAQLPEPPNRHPFPPPSSALRPYFLEPMLGAEPRAPAGRPPPALPSPASCLLPLADGLRHLAMPTLPLLCPTGTVMPPLSTRVRLPALAWAPKGEVQSQSPELTPKPPPPMERTENHHVSENLGGESGPGSARRSGRCAQSGGRDSMAKAVAGGGLAAVLTFAADQTLQHPPLLLQGLGDRAWLRPSICGDRVA